MPADDAHAPRRATSRRRRPSAHTRRSSTPWSGWVASLGSDPASATRLGRLVVLAASAAAAVARVRAPGAVARPAQPGRGRRAADPDGGVLPGDAQHQCGRDPRRDRDGGGRGGLRPSPGVARPVRAPRRWCWSAARRWCSAGSWASSPWRCSPCCSWSSAAGATCGPGFANGGRSPGRRSSSRRSRPSRSRCGSCATTTPCCSAPGSPRDSFRGFREQWMQLMPGERRLVRLARRAAALRRQPRLVRRGGRAGRHRRSSSATAATAIVLLGVLLVALVVSYVTYSRVFFGINAGLQGRHVLPIFALVPIWSGVVVAERLRPRLFAVGVRVAAVALPLVVLIGLYLNAQAVCGGPRTRTRVRAGSSPPPSGRRRWAGTPGWFSGSPGRWLSGSRGSGPWGKSGSGQGRPGDVTDVRRWAALRTSETCPRPSPPPLRPPPPEPAVAGRGRCCGSSPSSPR